jgi:hypothetical protein
MYCKHQVGSKLEAHLGGRMALSSHWRTPPGANTITSRPAEGLKTDPVKTLNLSNDDFPMLRGVDVEKSVRRKRSPWLK